MDIQFIESNKDDLIDILNVRVQGKILYKIESNAYHRKNNVAKQLEATGRFDVRNTKLESIEDIIAFCRLFRAHRYETLSHKEDYSIIVYLNTQREVVAVQDVCSKEFNDSLFHSWIRKEKIKNGATSAFLYTDSFEVFNKSVMDVIDRQLTDSFYTRKNGITISASDYGTIPINSLPDDLKIYNEKFHTS